MNYNSTGRMLRPLEIKKLRKPIKQIGVELKGCGFTIEEELYSLMEYVREDILVSIEFVEDEMLYYGIVVNAGKTKIRHKINNLDSYTLFVRDMRKVIRYNLT